MSIKVHLTRLGQCIYCNLEEFKPKDIALPERFYDSYKYLIHQEPCEICNENIGDLPQALPVK